MLDFKLDVFYLMRVVKVCVLMELLYYMLKCEYWHENLLFLGGVTYPFKCW